MYTACVSIICLLELEPWLLPAGPEQLLSDLSFSAHFSAPLCRGRNRATVELLEECRTAGCLVIIMSTVEVRSGFCFCKSFHSIHTNSLSSWRRRTRREALIEFFCRGRRVTLHRESSSRSLKFSSERLRSPDPTSITTSSCSECVLAPMMLELGGGALSFLLISVHLNELLFSKKRYAAA